MDFHKKDYIIVRFCMNRDDFRRRLSANIAQHILYDKK